MSTFRLSNHAADDLNDIWFYVAETAGEDTAESTMRRLMASFRKLADTPGLGHTRRDLTSQSVHFFLANPYLIVYARASSPLTIFRVIHSARDVKTLFRTRPL